MTLFRCNETDQLVKYRDLNLKLYEAAENEIYEMTGCLSTCDKYEFAVQPMTDLTLTKTTDEKKANTMRLAFYFTSGRHDLREEVQFQDFHLVNDLESIRFSLKNQKSSTFVT